MSAAPRIVSRPPADAPVYVWELPVRITHWLIFLSIIVLAATGYYLGHPFIAVNGPPRDHFVMGTVRVIHLYTAIVFTLAVFVRVYWMLAGNRYARWSELVPVTRRRLRSVWQTMRFYGYVRRNPPLYMGHSGLAGVAYAIVFLIYFMMIGTGLALYTVYAPTGSPFQLFRFLIPIFGGLQIVRLVHHIGMWLLLIFVVHHVYSAILFSTSERTGIIGSMFSGYKLGHETEDRDE
jgi:Ni/Fe-hydrogenase 1 B-type cytochrome subunit